jgi:apolipoprotein N-acyltransferase
MKDIQKNSSTFNPILAASAATIFSGLCWYFSYGLTGNFWYLQWFAPIPVLIVSFKTSAKTAFLVSFLAYLIGRLSWFSYLVSVATLVPAIISILILSLIFALITISARKSVIKSNSWYSVFAFPVLFTAFEFLLAKFSPDGTASSIAYSQSNFIPAIQIASVTGILGITFLVTFFPSAIAVGWYYRKETINFRNILVITVAIMASSFLFGAIRISNSKSQNAIKVGLAVLQEKYHNITDHPDFEKEKSVTENYAGQVADLAAMGAELVVLPERAINITKETADQLIGILGNVAKQNHIFIIAGYTNFRNEPERNSALVIDNDGNVVAGYNKVHLVKGLEREFTPGSEIGLFKVQNVPAGVAICKDLDFPGYIRKYGKASTVLLCVPAWDFVVDDWLHDRMAVLRGVENGFSEVRTARQGRLTISDCYGRVTSEETSSKGQAATLTGNASLQKVHTIYSRFGDWFGILNVIAASLLIFFRKRNKNLQV